MKIVVKVRLSSAKQKFEAFGNNRYLIGLISSNHEEGNDELLDLLSKNLGTPRTKIYFLSGEEADVKNLQIE